MRLLTVGDSFTYGEELSDVNNAWPFLLGKKLGYEITNLAKPGSGNTRMIRNVIENAIEYDLIIIAWTCFARLEISDEHGAYDIWPGCNYQQYKSSSPWRVELVHYYSKHYDDVYMYKQHLLNIMLLQNWLIQNNKKYIMLDSFANDDEFTLQKLKHTDIIKQIDPTYYLGWPTQTMMEWTYGAPQGPNGHFLEQGHAIVANKIYEHIRYLGWVS